MDKTSIKQEIIKYLESQGHASKSKIEKEVGELTMSTGDCIARRMRELVAEGVVRKDQKEYQGKKYWEYSVVPDLDELSLSEITKEEYQEILGI